MTLKKRAFWKKKWLKEKNAFPNGPWCIPVCSASLLKTLWEKEKLLVTSNFSLSSVFSTRWDNCLPFSSSLKFFVYKFFHFGSLKSVVWDRVKTMFWFFFFKHCQRLIASLHLIYYQRQLSAGYGPKFCNSIITYCWISTYTLNSYCSRIFCLTMQ